MTLAIAALFVFEHLSTPLPLNDLRVPAVYRRIAADPGDFAVLELPTGWRNGARVLGKSDVLIMMQQWYQTAHGKRRLGGNTSRNPAYKFQYFTEAPLIGDLIALMNADRAHIAAVVGPNFADLVARNRPLAPRILAFLGVKYVVVHVDKSPELLLRFVQEALPIELIDVWQGPDWSGAPAEIRLYQVRADAAPAAWQADLSSPAGRLYLGSGWSALEAPGDPLRYATRPVSQLLLDVPDRGGLLQLELAKGAATPPSLTLNGRDLAAPALRVDDAGRTWAEIIIPPSIAGELVDTLALTWRDDPLPLFALEPGAALSVRSAGEEVGNFAHIYVNGIDVTPNTRGYNLAALTPAGDLLAAAAFDTHAMPQASHDLAAWLQQWPAGTVIAGAVADEASYSLQAEAVDALQQLGVQTDLRGHFRWSHAFIGATGAPPASAAEQANLIAPAAVLIGPPVDAAQVYGAAGELRFSPTD